MDKLGISMRQLPAKLRRNGKRSWAKLMRLARNLSLRQRILCALAAGLILLSAIIPNVQYFLESHRYKLDDSTLSLVGKANPNLAAKLTYDRQNSQWQFNKDVVTSAANQNKTLDPSQNIPAALKAQIGGGGKADESLYAINFPTNPKKGVTVYDAGTQLSFTMTPQFKVHGGQATKDGRLVYPMESGAQLIYTPKNNGMKEDIVLPKFIGKELSYSYKLDLPDSLTARVQDDGSVGVFSIDPALLGNVSTGSNMDAEKLRSAREHAEKNHLLFAIPAPVIAQTGSESVKATARFGLVGNVLTVTARSMDTLQYPVAVDPSVVVTSSTDFQLGGDDEGMIDYQTPDQIKRAAHSGGTIDSWSTTTSIPSGNYGWSNAASVAYNGRMYLFGGTGGASGDSSHRASVIYSTINSNGTLGAWASTTSLPAPRAMIRAVAYNGYIYILGGLYGSTSYDTVWFAPINADGTLGSWSTTSSFSGVRSWAGAAAYNGYIYVMGGLYNGVFGSARSDVQYAPIHADGTLGAWASTSSLPHQVGGMGSFAYNGYLYSMGGNDVSSNIYDDVQRAPINSDGTLGSWEQISTLPAVLAGGINSTSFNNGYVYVAGGLTSGWVKTNVVYYAPVLANGKLGDWRTTTSFATARAESSVVAYNQYLYVMGGDNASGTYYSDIQYAKITNVGSTSPYSTSGNTFTTNRRGAQTVIYGNYLYILGGDDGGTPVNTVYKALISSNGTIGSFTSTNAFTTARTYFAAVAYGGYMYVLGGCFSVYSACTTATNNLTTIYKSAINQDTGTLGAWSAEGNITTARYGLTAAVYNGYMYVMGGINGSTFNNTIQYHAINASNGTMSGAWTTSGKTLPASSAYLAATVYGGVLYVAGGCSAGALTCTTTRNTVHYASLATSGDLAATLASTAAFTTNRGDFGLTAVNGRLYLTGGRTNTTYYGDTQSAPINSDGTIGSWVAHNDTTLATTRYGIGMASAGGYLYVLGGYNGSTYYNNVQISYVNNGGGGNADSWSTDSSGPLSGGRSENQTVAYNGYLYVLGGRANGGGMLNTVEYAKINNADGSVGTWASTSSFTTARTTFAAAVMNGYMYILGGSGASSSYLKDIQYSFINSDGSLGAWASAGSNVFNAGQGACMAASNGYIYSLGGWDGTTDHNSVRYTATNANGTISGWQTATSFTGGRSNGQCVAYGGYLYMMGGEDTTGRYDVQYAVINSNGSLGAWAYNTGYDRGRVNLAAFVYNGYMYIMGGISTTISGGTPRNDMQYAPINPNGTLGAWQYTSAIGGYSYADAAVANGYVYVPGQQLETTTKYASLNSITRVGHYSKLVDLGTSGKVTGITYGGLLPGGSAQIDYRTAGSDGVFGTQYNVQRPPSPSGPCIGNYGSGRYVLVSVALDESSGISSNLTDLTVIYESYHPATDIRLHGGKTLQAGTLAPLDTCGVYS